MELNIETDFAAKEPEFLKSFRSLSQTLVSSNLRTGGLQSVMDLKHNGVVAGFTVSTVAEAVQQLTYLYKENAQLRRALLFPRGTEPNPKIHVYSYVHSKIDKVIPSIGKMVSLVQFATSVDPTAEQKSRLQRLGSILCTQIISGRPIILSGDKDTPRLSTVDNTALINEPDYEPRLLHQECVLEDGLISQIIKNFEKELGLEIQVQEFARWELNSGEDKAEGNLADDIRSLLKS